MTPLGWLGHKTSTQTTQTNKIRLLLKDQGSALFAIPLSSLRNKCVKIKMYSKNIWNKVFEPLEHSPFLHIWCCFCWKFQSGSSFAIYFVFGCMLVIVVVLLGLVIYCSSFLLSLPWECCVSLAKECAQYWLPAKRTACPVKVLLGKLTVLNMTPMGWLGHKTSTQTTGKATITKHDN